MASNTENLGLYKKDPVADGNDNFNVETMLNENWDKIDAAANRYYVDGAASDAYTITIPGITAYTQLVGVPIRVKCNTANSSACTLNVNALGAKAIARGVNTALITGDILAGMIVELIYDGTQFQLKSQGADASQASKAETLANKTLTAPKFATGGFIADSNGNQLIAFPATVASAVNEVLVSNAAAGTGPTVAVTGDDANINLTLQTKGTGKVRMYVGNLLSGLFDAVASAVNYFTFTSNPAGTAPAIAAAGTDANIDINLIPKGTGKVKFNGNALATEAQVSIKTAAATLLATGWTGASVPYTQTLAIDANLGVTATSVQEYKINSTTKSVRDAFGAAMIDTDDAAQAVNSITFKCWGQKPTVDLPITLVRGVL